jgi:hypothetical protein
VPDLDRGTLILSFRLPFDGSAWRSLLVVAGAWAAFELPRRSWRSHWSEWALMWPLLTLVVALLQIFRRTVKFYSNGVYLPPDDGRKIKARFLKWVQIERFSFDGDMLDLTGTGDTLKGGPVIGATLKVPAGYQAQVMSLLAGNVR